MKVYWLLALLLPVAASARVFDMKELNVAPYLRGTFGPSIVKKEAYVHELPSGDTVEGSSAYNYSGELGVLFHLLPQMNLRLGAEILQPTSVTSAKGYDSTGGQLFTMNSQVFVFNPQVAVEIIAKEYKMSRVLIMAGAGSAFVSAQNDFTMTTAGQTALGLGSYTEKASAQVLNGFVSAGFETFFVNQAMVMVEAGYRYFPVSSLSHSQDEKTIAETTGASKGASVLNYDKGKRKFDLSGAFVGLSVRFYLQ